jgi:high-affinity iron transporter
VASLAAIAWGIFALGMRLPLRQFFALSAILMVVLALVFAGKGVAALQEAGQLAQHALPLPRIELLGIYPNAQGLVLQAALLGLVVAMVLYNRRRAAVALDDRS